MKEFLKVADKAALLLSMAKEVYVDKKSVYPLEGINTPGFKPIDVSIGDLNKIVFEQGTDFLLRAITYPEIVSSDTLRAIETNLEKVNRDDPEVFSKALRMLSTI